MNLRRYHCIGFIRKHPNLFRTCSNVALIAWFVFYLSSSTYLYKSIDDFLKDSDLKQFALNNLTDLQLHAILDQRGVVSSHFLDRIDLELAVNATGFVCKNELEKVELRQLSWQSINLATNPDAILYRDLIGLNYNTPDALISSNQKPISIIFESELDFVEQVEDNKDSVWLLVVVANQSTPSFLIERSKSIITDEIWVSLVQRYNGIFGFKMGLLICEKLQGICIDRNFIQADFILALPRGGNRMKDHVQFRPFPRDPQFSNSSSQLLDVLDYWINAVLGERIQTLESLRHLDSNFPFNDPTDSQMYYWKWLGQYLIKKPQPLHFLWIHNQNHVISKPFSIPLVLSALSVLYTGRVRFWQIYSPQTIDQLQAFFNRTFQFVNFSTNQFLIWTPTYNQFYSFGSNGAEFLDYYNLEFILHLLYPSVDDLFWLFLICINSFVILNAFIEVGQILATTKQEPDAVRRKRSMKQQSSIGQRRRQHRLNLAKTVIRLARRGWTAYCPSRWMYSNLVSNQVAPIPTMNQPVQIDVSRYWAIPIVWKKLAIWTVLFSADLFTANFLVLISFLPILNAFHSIYLMPIVNVVLYALRACIIRLPLTQLYAVVIQGYLNWSILVGLTFIYIFGLVWASTYFYHRLADDDTHPINLNVSHDQSSRFSMDRLWNDLIQILVQSDVEFRLSTNDESDEDKSNMVRRFKSNDDDDDDEWCSNVEMHESTRLLHRLYSLYHVLKKQIYQDDASTSHIAQSDQNYMTEAHMYTWIYHESLNAKGNTKSTRKNYTTTKLKRRTKLTHNRLYSSHDTDYEAEDESDYHMTHSLFCRPRHYQHRGSIRRHSLSATSSLTSLSGNSLDELACHAETLSPKPIYWPPWVIGCETCVVCWRKFRSGVCMCALPCGHGFHKVCIRKWLDTGAVDCPVCRWPAYAPHLRQQCHIVDRLIQEVQCTINRSKHK